MKSIPNALLALACALALACGAVPPGAARPPTYVAVGASDSVGVGASDPATRSWPALLATRLPVGSRHHNLAVSGSTVAQARREQLPRVAPLDPNVITVWLAVNDLNAGIGPRDYARELGALLDELLARTGARIFVGTVPDLALVPVYAQVDPTVLRARVDAYNRAIAEVIRARGGRVVLVDLFEGSDVIAKELVVAPDGFHPNDRGYELIAERFAEVMRAAGVPVR